MYLAVVESQGNITWIPMTKLVITCPKVDTHYACSWKFGSWTHSGFQIDIFTIYNSIDMASYTSNPDWQVFNISSTRNVVYYSCCREPYIDITYAMNIQKKPPVRKGGSTYEMAGLFNYAVQGNDEVHASDMTYILLLPTVIVSLLVPFQFLVPPESSQRISVCK